MMHLGHPARSTVELSTLCIKLVGILNEGIFSSIKALRSHSYEGEYATKSEGKRALQNA